MIETDKEMEEKHQSLMDHLTELRIRIINSGYSIFAGTGISYAFSEKIFNLVRQPIAKYLPMGGLVFTSPMDKFIAHLKLSLACGIIISAPFWLYQIWLFVAPGLYAKERRYASSFIGGGTVLFLAGVAFSYLVVLPAAFHFLMTYGGDVDKPMITIDHYLSFFTQTCLMFGAAFELPMIMIVLGMLGVVKQKFLREKRRYAVMILAVVSAVITPPDAISMMMMLGPMLALYETGVFFVGFFEKKNVGFNMNQRE